MPGPRPYVFEKRAWHSDWHQPIRGSFIQQIFRVVHETHSVQTKKNKEWQEKLPIVVFKAEEILYSKANSEDEYMNLDTLWDRVTDAVDTIIRRDESTETGELLPPCVEAALYLGCTPNRASRSHQHSNPKTYLNPRLHEPSLPPEIVDKTIEEWCINFSSLHSSSPSNFARSSMSVNSPLLVPESRSQIIGNDNLVPPPSCSSLYENIPSGHSKMTVDSDVPLNFGAVYPLYYGTQLQTEDPKSRSGIPENLNPTTILIGNPVGKSIPEPAEMGALPHRFTCPGAYMDSKPTTKPDFHNFGKRPLIRECDLSLRLGRSGDPGY